MKIELFGRPTTFGDLKAGALFRSARGSEEYFALKIASTGKQGWVVLDPPPPPARDGALHISPSAPHTDDRPAFDLEDAIIRPSPDFRDWSLNEQISYGSGDVVLTADGKAYLCVLLGNDERHIDLGTGHVAPVPQAIAVVSVWSVVQMVDEKPRTLVKFTSRLAKQRAAAAAARTAAE